MSLPARLARTVTRWRYGHAARRALSTAVYGDCAEGHRIAAEAIERGGEEAARALAGTWCAAVLDGVPRSVRRSGTYRHDLTGTTREVPVRDAVAAIDWATALITAHARRDWVLCRSLVAGCLATGPGPRLAVLLHAAADATSTRWEDRW